MLHLRIGSSEISSHLPRIKVLLISLIKGSYVLVPREPNSPYHPSLAPFPQTAHQIGETLRSDCLSPLRRSQPTFHHLKYFRCNAFAGKSLFQAPTIEMLCILNFFKSVTVMTPRARIRPILGVLQKIDQTRTQFRVIWPTPNPIGDI